MLTREQIEEIQAKSREKGISIKTILEEKGIPSHQYFWWKRKYSKPDVPEGFLPLVGGMPPPAIPIAGGPGSSRGKSKVDPAGENWMNIELRTVSATAGTSIPLPAHNSQKPVAMFSLVQ